MPSHQFIPILPKCCAVLHPHKSAMPPPSAATSPTARPSVMARPALIALGTTLTLRKGGTRREILLQDFFIDYGKQDIAAGEFVESIFIPAQEDRLKCYKLTKRFDQDISAVLGCFNIHIKDGLVACCAIAYWRMAATPKRASHVEKALLGKPWTKETITVALPAFAIDFTPMSDIRASREYRLKAAQNTLLRYFLEDLGEAPRVLDAAS